MSSNTEIAKKVDALLNQIALQPAHNDIALDHAQLSVKGDRHESPILTQPDQVPSNFKINVTQRGGYGILFEPKVDKLGACELVGTGASGGHIYEKHLAFIDLDAKTLFLVARKILSVSAVMRNQHPEAAEFIDPYLAIPRLDTLRSSQTLNSIHEALAPVFEMYRDFATGDSSRPERSNVMLQNVGDSFQVGNLRVSRIAEADKSPVVEVEGAVKSASMKDARYRIEVVNSTDREPSLTASWKTWQKLAGYLLTDSAVMAPWPQWKITCAQICPGGLEVEQDSPRPSLLQAGVNQVQVPEVSDLSKVAHHVLALNELLENINLADDRLPNANRGMFPVLKAALGQLKESWPQDLIPPVSPADEVLAVLGHQLKGKVAQLQDAVGQILENRALDLLRWEGDLAGREGNVSAREEKATLREQGIEQAVNEAAAKLQEAERIEELSRKFVEGKMAEVELIALQLRRQHAPVVTVETPVAEVAVEVAAPVDVAPQSLAVEAPRAPVMQTQVTSARRTLDMFTPEYIAKYFERLMPDQVLKNAS